MMPPQPTANGNQQAGMRRQYIAQQQTLPQPVVFPPPINSMLPNNSGTQLQPPVPVVSPLAATVPTTSSKKKFISRIIAIVLVIGLAVAIYVVWNTATPTTTTSSSPSSNVSQQNFTVSGTTVSTTNEIRVYVVGAVKHPGLYTLAADARVYDLIQAAGGTLPTANLIAINLAAKLSDGQEVYIVQVGETPPPTTGGVPSTGSGTTTGGTTGISGASTSSGQLVNINTASLSELTLSLHISKKTAQTIIDYRTQNGNYSSVDQLALVVSHTIYNKIKGQCTI